ncbi:MAG: hypothetical protein ACD_43C00118G0005 [uncultured bacterium]|nr:MAG: hypothetical protein ACD_43C00118G0005 [uncultured bacterium]
MVALYASVTAAATGLPSCKSRINWVTAARFDSGLSLEKW